MNFKNIQLIFVTFALILVSGCSANFIKKVRAISVAYVWSQSGSNNYLNIIRFDYKTGAVTKMTSTDVSLFPGLVEISPDRKWIIACRVGSGIQVFPIDVKSGEISNLTPAVQAIGCSVVSHFRAIAFPSESNRVFIATGGGTNLVIGLWSIGSDGTLTLLGSTPSLGAVVLSSLTYRSYNNSLNVRATNINRWYSVDSASGVFNLNFQWNSSPIVNGVYVSALDMILGHTASGMQAYTVDYNSSSLDSFVPLTGVGNPTQYFALDSNARFMIGRNANLQSELLVSEWTGSAVIPRSDLTLTTNRNFFSVLPKIDSSSRYFYEADYTDSVSFSDSQFVQYLIDSSTGALTEQNRITIGGSLIFTADRWLQAI